MDINDYLTSFRADGERIRMLTTQDMSLPIPCCEGWSLGDLVGHLCGVLTMINTVVESGAPPTQRPIVPADAALATFYGEALERLDATLTNT
ncbi:MAG: maleylpyruvate isomerase N-terminal domain-containing protein, partial [Acidimicrobiales bacterium]